MTQHSSPVSGVPYPEFDIVARLRAAIDPDPTPLDILLAQAAEVIEQYRSDSARDEALIHAQRAGDIPIREALVNLETAVTEYWKTERTPTDSIGVCIAQADARKVLALTSTVREVCQTCMGSGYSNHPDSGEVCHLCKGQGEVTSLTSHNSQQSGE